MFLTVNGWEDIFFLFKWDYNVWGFREMNMWFLLAETVRKRLGLHHWRYHSSNLKSDCFIEKKHNYLVFICLLITIQISQPQGKLVLLTLLSRLLNIQMSYTIFWSVSLYCSHSSIRLELLTYHIFSFLMLIKK